MIQFLSDNWRAIAEIIGLFLTWYTANKAGSKNVTARGLIAAAGSRMMLMNKKPKAKGKKKS